MNEVEVKYIDVNPDKLEKKLLSLGAKKVSDEMLEEWLYAKPEWESTRGRVRVRQEGKTVMLAYKETVQSTSKGNLEIEFQVPDAEKARLFVEKMGVDTPRHQQKRRIHYVWKNISIDIDFWPLIPPIVEIEGEEVSELESLAKALDLDEKKRCDLDAFQIYEQIYNVPIRTMKELVFKKQAA